MWDLLKDIAISSWDSIHDWWTGADKKVFVPNGTQPIPDDIHCPTEPMPLKEEKSK